MTKEQIKILDYCRGYLDRLQKYKKEMPFKPQEFGCGSRSPDIEHRLQRLHTKMYEQICHNISVTEKEVQDIIDKC